MTPHRSGSARPRPVGRRRPPPPSPARGRGASPWTSVVLAGLVLALLPALAPALPLVPSGALPAQTILNVERFQIGELEGGHAAIDLSGSGQLGNARVLEARMEGIAGRLGERHWPRIILGGRYLRERGEDPILDNRFVQLRYSWLLGPRARTFHFVQLQRNETLLLRSRWLAGSGARRTLLGGEKGSLDLGTGVMYEEERLDAGSLEPDEDSRTRTWRAANLLSAAYELDGGATFWNVAYFQPDLGSFADFRLLNEVALTFPLADPVTVVFSADWRHDSRPPALLRRNDVTFRTGVSIELR